MSGPAGAGLRVLVVASKPPWPRVGGGNVTLHDLLGGLVAVGAQVRLVVADPRTAGDLPESPWPAVSVRSVRGLPHPWWRVAPHLLVPPPMSLARFRDRRLAAAVREEIRAFAPDVVHLEQLHMAWLAAVAQAAGLPAVLRQQNVESDLAIAWGRLRGGPLGWLLGREGRRLARAEGAACREVDRVLAISDEDAARLRRLAGRANVEVLPAAFAASGVAARGRLAGNPPILALGSFDWGPTREGMAWFLAEGWPRLREALPESVLHLAGPGSDTLGAAGDRVVVHGVVAEVASLYAPRAVSLVPLRVGSGVRLRLLEAWAAEVPVVTTPVGGAGLVARDGDGARLAASAEALAQAVAAVARDEAERRALVAAGRAKLTLHAPEVVAAAALRHYREVLAEHRGGRG
jgi:glycosyltransferase involved in cell wall biosynthesis